MSGNDLVSIGRFSRLSGLSVKALRRYGEAGLLAPARVDEASGYRFYERGQVAHGVAIRRLRRLGVPLAEIAAILEGKDVGARLAAQRERLRRLASELESGIAALTALIDGEEELVPGVKDFLYELAIKSFEDQPVLAIRERVPADELPQVVPAHYAELFSYLDELEAEPAEPAAITICPFADERGQVELETTVCLGAPLPGRGRIESSTLPACTGLCLSHHGPYTDLSLAYRALSEWVELHGFATAGPPREIYWSDPAATPDPADNVTEVVWPIEPDPARLEAFRRRAGEKFRRPVPAP